MENRVLSLLSALAAAPTFEDAADATVAAMLALAVEALAASRYAKLGRILRGMVHLRPADGYRRLSIVEHNGDTATKGSLSILPSATAWGEVARHGVPIAVDVQESTFDIGATGAAETARHKSSGRFGNRESRERLLRREATHLLLLPLRAPGGALHGMFSLEAHCPVAIGDVFVFPSCRDGVQALAALGAPYLCTLPLRLVPAAEPDGHLPVVGESMAGTVEVLRGFARQDETVLLSGPTGAGKSRLALWCHEQSERRGHAFETLDLSTVPEELQMAEISGWKKGAFTGAVKDTPGAIDRARAGTLFIDEIDKLSLKGQAGLLRVLEERKYRPLGEGADEHVVRARFVVGTNADLRAAVRSGRFREDLYYRINVLPVKVPPLAERRDEIAEWAAYMLDRKHRGGRPARAILSAEAKQLLVAEPWPGNLRQLDNILRRASALALVALGDVGEELHIEANHVRQALTYEEGSGASLVEQFQVAAAAFVAEAERQKAAGDALNLDLVDAMRGFVLCTATLKLGSKEKAFRLLGKEAMVQNRNHHKQMRRDLERVEELCRAIGDIDNPFASIADDGER